MKIELWPCVFFGYNLLVVLLFGVCLWFFSKELKFEASFFGEVPSFLIQFTN